jgi:Family of unknown function (DUF5681)
MTKVVIVGTGMRPKLRPRGKPFRKGERHAFQFKPGQSGNPGGKPKIHQRIGAEYATRLLEPVPQELAAVLGVEPGTHWAEAIARAVIARAARGDVSAAREVREVTEGRTPATLNLEGKIDYAAGQNAKRRLLKQLGGKVS